MNQAEDVEVVLGYGRHYKFHSGTLARNSPRLADMLTEPNAVRLSSRARNAGVKIRWMIELTSLPCDKYPAGIFELIKLTRTGERADKRNGLIVNENGLIPQAEKCFKQYESIFYAFYNKELVIDDSNMTAALEHCYNLLEKSDYLGCTNVISKPIEVALLKHGQDVYRAIANTPYAWIDMAFRVRSELLFRECIVHLVGSWRCLVQQPHLGIRERVSRIPGLLALIERHHTQLLARCQTLELSVMSLYPSKVLSINDDLPAMRGDYKKDILCWLAVTFFREWITQRLVMDEGRHAADCGYALYKQLAAGPDANLDREILKQVQEEKFPMTTKALRVVEHHLREIKKGVKEVVEEHGILKSNCQLDMHKFPVNYLTCVVLEKREYPWRSHVQAEREALRARKRYMPGGNDIAMLNLNSARRSKELNAANIGKRDERDEGDDEFESDDMDSEYERGKRMRMN